jgi:hypothetical protein
MSKIKDKLKYEFNVFTEELDLVSEFNTDRIITHEKNNAGHMLMTYDPATGLHVPMEPMIVVDNNGNVVVVK